MADDNVSITNDVDRDIQDTILQDVADHEYERAIKQRMRYFHGELLPLPTIKQKKSL